jgi:hypothetical protein
MKQTFKTIVMLATGVLMSSGAAAQINFTQPKVAEPKAPDPLEGYSEEQKKAILAPYDSTELTIPTGVPVLEFYKKFVGQRLFIYKRTSPSLLFSSKSTRWGKFGDKKKTYLYAPANGSFSSVSNDTSILNKYYDIVDVVNLWDFKDEDFTLSVYCNYGRDCHDIQKLKKIVEREKAKPQPILVVKAVENGETLYTPLRSVRGPITRISGNEEVSLDGMVLVGAMVKWQQTLVGETLLIGYNNEGAKTVEWSNADKWKCVNVSIVNQGFFPFVRSYAEKFPSLVLQCISEGEKKGEERALPIGFYYKKSLTDYGDGMGRSVFWSWRLEKEYEKEQAEKAEKKRIADEQAARVRAAKEAQEKEAREAREKAEQEALEARQKQRIADSIKTQRRREEEEQQKAAEKVQRKKDLIAKYGPQWGPKVFEGKPVVGMTIAMCKDAGIANFRKHRSEVKTAKGKVEVWVVNLLFATQTLTFVNGKLTEIETGTSF